jgi:hypothetical protein
MLHPKFIQLLSWGDSAQDADAPREQANWYRNDKLIALAEDGSVWWMMGNKWIPLTEQDKLMLQQ